MDKSKKQNKPVPKREPKKKEMNDNEINNVLMSIGKKSRDPNKKNFVGSFVDKIKSKTEADSDSENCSVKSVKSTKSIKKNKSTKFDRPQTTFTDNLTKEDVEKKLEDYKKVDDINKIPVGTHLRYFVKKDGELVFRMGGLLKSNAGLPKFLILKNAEDVQWSVQVKDTIFYKKMTIQEIKDEYELIVEELNQKIKKLKEKIKELQK